MILTTRMLWIVSGLFALSFLIELLAEQVSFFSRWLASQTFWTSIGITTLLVTMELVSVVYGFVENHFYSPWKAARAYNERINREREKIEKLLAYNIEGVEIAKLEKHYEALEDCRISKEALAPYMLDWCAHVESVHNILQMEREGEELEHFEQEKAKIQEEIEKLRAEKEELMERENEPEETENKESEKDAFLKEHEMPLFVYAHDCSKEEQEWLNEAGFTRTHQWDLLTKENTEMFIKPRSNEGNSHAYMTGALKKYLQDELGEDEVKLYQTKLPDIVFRVAGIDFAIEVETGSGFRKNSKELRKKVRHNNRKYKDGWFFVVTNKNLLAKYRTLAETVDRKSVLDKIDSIIYPEGRPEE